MQLSSRPPGSMPDGEWAEEARVPAPARLLQRLQLNHPIHRPMPPHPLPPPPATAPNAAPNAAAPSAAAPTAAPNAAGPDNASDGENSDVAAAEEHDDGDEAAETTDGASAWKPEDDFQEFSQRVKTMGDERRFNPILNLDGYSSKGIFEYTEHSSRCTTAHAPRAH